MTTINNPILAALVDDIDGSLDTIVGDSDFTDREVMEALTSIRDRLTLCLDQTPWVTS